MTNESSSNVNEGGSDITERDLAEAISVLLDNEAESVGLEAGHTVSRVRTLAEAGYMTQNEGLEVRLRNGQTFVLTITGGNRR